MQWANLGGGSRLGLRSASNKMNQAKWTTLLVYIAAVVERADEQVLPAVYFFVGRSFGATPTQLGALTFWRAIVQAIASPVSGMLGDRYDRTKVIAAGCIIWGVMTSAIAMSSSVLQAKIYAGFNGIGLALVIPCCQSILADLYSSESRGVAFGFMQTTGAIGVMVGGMFATNLGHMTPFGYDGWRVALHIVAALSVITGIQVLSFARDPRGSKAHKGKIDHDLGLLEEATDSLMSDVQEKPIHKEILKQKTTVLSSAGKSLQEIKWLLSIRSFQVVILQGVVGSLPWNAMVFFTLWLQLLGFSDFSASVMLAIFHFGTALGGALGGALGDRMATLYPNSGRIMVAQFSVFAGLPLSFILLYLLPLGGLDGMSFLYGLVFFTMGATISWTTPACNSPVFADVVPRALYSRIYAFDRSFEGAIAATAAPLVGIISEKVFGFQGDVASRQGADSGNAGSLGKSLLVFLVVPWTLCFLSYSGLYWTYPRDKSTAREKPPKELV